MEHFFVVFFLLGVAICSGSDVLDLSGEGAFKEEVGKHDVMLVEFFAPWCGHCKKLAPEFELAATKLSVEDPPIPLAKVDCTEESGGKEICSKFGVTGYPTLKIFRNGEFSADYAGGRTESTIVTEMKKHSGPLAKQLKSAEQLTKAYSSGLRTVVAGFFSKDGKDKESFVQAASKLHENYRMMYSLSAEINKEFDISQNSVVLFRPDVLKNKFEESQVTMSDSITKSNIEKFVRKNGYGLCPVLTPDSKKDVKGPLIVVYYKVDYAKNKKGTNYWRNRVMKVATKYTEEDVKFGVADSSDFREELTALGFAPNLENPVAAAWDSSGSKYKMEEDMTPDGKTLSEFVSKFLAGEVEPHLKSEAIPEPNDGPVKVVVGKTFSDIVMDETKDVLIEFYAPWCGHCKQLEPKYEELGEKMKEFEHVVIAKMDATANDSPGAFEVSGFPTIYWAPAGRKSNPQKYQGGREVDDFVKFIKKESSKPINLKPTKKTDEL